jgi:hypothetical protein
LGGGARSLFSRHTQTELLARQLPSRRDESLQVRSGTWVTHACQHMGPLVSGRPLVLICRRAG